MIIALLVAAVLVVFGRTVGFDFVGYDDNVYVTENPLVRGGLTLPGLLWALTDHQIYWHPLTWVSLMIDAWIGGGRPAVFHATSVLIHLVNTLLLFLVLDRMTSRAWRSGFVAALFAVHPLHVESVAWISERKDVLSALFWFLTILMYLRYARSPSVARFVPVVIGLLLGLMSKPMVVTLPLVLLLLDGWPLGRFAGAAVDAPGGRRRLFAPFLEKIPLFALSSLACAFAIVAQARSGAMGSVERYPAWVRLANAAVAYVTYLVRTVWPSGLAVLYPHRGEEIPVTHAVASAAVLAVVSGLALRAARRRPYLAVGWFWYLVTLLPAIGLVQVGVQGMADRYTYLPLVGIFIVIAWGVPDLLSSIFDRPASASLPPGAEDWAGEAKGGATRHGETDLQQVVRGRRAERDRSPIRAFLTLAAVSCTIVLMGCAWVQVGHWRDGVTLFRRSVEATARNKFAHNNLGLALYAAGRKDEAAADFRLALEIDPSYADAHSNLAAVLSDMGKTEEAIAHCRTALDVDPDHAAALTNLGRALMLEGKLDQAEAELSHALRVKPGSIVARNNLAVCLAQQGRLEEAIREFTEVLRRAPDTPDARENLERARSLLETRSPR